MMVKKVNIDELVDILLNMRKETQFIDLLLEADNVLKVRKHTPQPTPPDQAPDISNDLNQLIG